jgi:ferritin-like metal-binding protein YciE
MASFMAHLSYLRKHFLNNFKMAIMKTNTMNASTTTDSKLHEFFLDQLKDLYWAEKKLVKTLPKLEDAATSQELKDALRNHCEQTKQHVSRLENVFNMIGEEVDSTKCPAMAGIVDEGSDIIDETDDGSAQRDVGLIFAGQKAEHYEIATYGGLVQLAKTLGYNDAANLMSQTLAEEKQADALLTQIAESSANRQAKREPQNSW